jgi:CheY-like chemotaxis protein
MSPKSNFQVVPISEAPKTDVVVYDKKPQPLVLVVDDERVIADTLSMILSKCGFTTMTAYDGTSALQLANAAPPDLIITDVMMPGMTGIELAITISKTIPTCKILLFSGQAATVDLLEQARGAGYNFTTLTKPVHPTDMLRRISEYLTIPTVTAPAKHRSATRAHATN